MNKSYSLPILGLLFFSLLYIGCSSNKTSVKGKMVGLEPQKFSVQELGLTETPPIDSGVTSAEGTFQFDLDIKEEGLYKIVFEKGKYILLALQQGDQAVIDGSWSELENYQVTGSQSSATLKSFLVNLRENMRDIQTLAVIMDSVKARANNDSLKLSVQQDMREVNDRFMNYARKFADTTTSVASALFVAKLFKAETQTVYLASFFENITKRFPQSANARKYADQFLSGLQATATGTTGAASSSAAPDFTSLTPSGESLTLSSLRGKYVLLDFWASWCPPCRAENPNVVKAYQEFNTKNFTVLGVSLDTDKAKWMKAIEQDELAWAQVSELKGWQSVIARNYGVEEIPMNFLLDPQGNIIAKDLRGEALQQKLHELLP